MYCMKIVKKLYTVKYLFQTKRWEAAKKEADYKFLVWLWHIQVWLKNIIQGYLTATFYVLYESGEMIMEHVFGKISYYVVVITFCFIT